MKPGQFLLNQKKAPVAAAGIDQVVNDSDLDGTEAVILNGSLSGDADGTIASYEWKEGETVLGTGVILNYYFSVGIHNIDLTITDNGGQTATDQVAITIEQNLLPVAEAGLDRQITDIDENGAESITLDGSASIDPDGTIIAYEWREGAVVLGTQTTLNYDFTIGSHAVDLIVTDNAGAIATDSVLINVLASTAAPIITNVTAVEITENSARIIWLTDENSNSRVDYGETILDQQAGDLVNTLTHSVILTNLLPKTTYNYQVVSDDVFGNQAIAGTYSFTTEAWHSDAYATGVAVNFGSVISGTIMDTQIQDSLTQSFNEGPNGVAGMSALDLTYTLFTPANPIDISSFDLYYTGNWTGNAEGDGLRAFIKTGSGWQEITADLLTDGVFSPSANLYELADANGNIQVRFTDSNLVKKETKDTLAIDLLKAVIVAGAPINYPPTANNNAVTTPVDTAVAATLVASDPNNDVLSYSIITNPINGVLTGIAPNLVYTPNPGFAGQDSFTFIANDGEFDSNAATVSINVYDAMATVHIENITMSIFAGKKYYVQAAVAVDPALSGATITGDWYFKGLIAGSETAITDTTGVSLFTSPEKPARSGDVFTFTVTGVVLEGHTYSPADNVVSTVVIAVP